MHSLNLPAYPLRVKMVKDRQMIFDNFRKKFVALTPEEWVRQHFLNWMSRSKGYPSGLIAVEVPLKYNNLHKRADAVVYDKEGNTLMIVECKAPTVAVSQTIVEQIAMYNFIFGVRYVVLTNGMQQYCFMRNETLKQWVCLDGIPSYHELETFSA